MFVISLLVVWFVGWLVGRSVDRLVGWLGIGRLMVGFWLVVCFIV
jgi:hypothetical protein